MRRWLVPVVAVISACGSPGARQAPTPESTEAPARTTVDFVTDWPSLERRAHAILRGVLTFEADAMCAVTPTTRVCTPTTDVIGWHASDPLAPGDDRWIVTEQVDGVERIAVAIAASPRFDALDDSTRAALADQYRCGQLGRFWGEIPATDLACDVDTDCRVLTSTCFTVAVAERAAAPYVEVHDRIGGVCLHPAGGMCGPSRARPACLDGRCSHVD